MKIEKKHIAVAYFIVTGLVLAIWYTKTQNSNYFQGTGSPDPELLEALSRIFTSKVLFWSIFLVLLFNTVNKAYSKKLKGMILFIGISTVYFIGADMYTDYRCAAQYYRVLQHQQVSQEDISNPIKEAGYQIGSILTEKITDKNEPYRKYEIEGLGHLKYKPATNTLSQILFDRTEPDSIITASYKALKNINTTKSATILKRFRKEYNDDLEMLQKVGAFKME